MVAHSDSPSCGYDLPALSERQLSRNFDFSQTLSSAFAAILRVDPQLRGNKSRIAGLSRRGRHPPFKTAPVADSQRLLNPLFKPSARADSQRWRSQAYPTIPM